MKASTIQRFTLLAFLFVTVWYSFYCIQPPEVVPKDSAPTSFSAERAFKHVRVIAQKPRPLGSAENDSTHRYLINKLRKIGLNPRVQEGIGKRTANGIAGYTKNIIAKIPGRNPNNTILLMSHYDSVPNSPGAADDGSGTAAILETVRAIQSQKQPLKNDIWILLTDGEERGLLGANLFVDTFEELDSIDLALNFEARGTSGPSMMFETSSPNSGLIPHFAQATPHPVANSLMYTVYKLMPNNTDLSIIKRAGIKGLNFAFANDLMNYHTMQDNPQNLSHASLQHHGSNMLENTRYFAERNFDLTSKTEYVYFNNATGGLTYYSSVWSLPLAIVTALLFISYLIFLFRTQQLGILSYLGSLFLFLGMIILSAVLTYYGWQGIRWLHPQYQWLVQGEVYSFDWYFGAFSLLVIGLFSLVYSLSWIQRKLSIQQTLAGPYTLWVIISLVTAWYLPTVSYFFTWPVLMAMLGWLILGKNLIQKGWTSVVILSTSLFAVLFIISPYLYLIHVMLTTRLLAVSMILLTAVIGLTWPLVWSIIQSSKKIWVGTFFLSSLACFITASALSGYDTNHKKQDSVSYVQNLNKKTAYWISRDHRTDSWTRQFLGSNFKKGNISDIAILKNINLLYQTAPSTSDAAPKFTVLSDSTGTSLRYLSLEIQTKQRAIGMRLDWESLKEIGVKGTTVYSQLSPVKYQRNRMDRLYYFQDLSNPVVLNLILSNKISAPIFTFTFWKMGLPTRLISNYQARRPRMMPIPNRLSDASVWQTTVNIDSLNH